MKKFGYSVLMIILFAGIVLGFALWSKATGDPKFVPFGTAMGIVAVACLLAYPLQVLKSSLKRRKADVRKT
ncbi:MAG: hypothetical protein AAB577_01555 [Patescibacteria group bacterium]